MFVAEGKNKSLSDSRLKQAITFFFCNTTIRSSTVNKGEQFENECLSGELGHQTFA